MFSAFENGKSLKSSQMTPSLTLSILHFTCAHAQTLVLIEK